VWGFFGATNSIAVDSSGHAHISYSSLITDEYGVDAPVENLTYATNDSGDWVSTVVDSNDKTGGSSAIAVDASNAVHISYSTRIDGDAGSALKYATNASGSWLLTSVDSGWDWTGTSSADALAVDGLAHAHVSYRTTAGSLNHATNAP
jgi:hypothetical protein